jgi:Copper binding proteins, plastocyanin/azurin family
MTQLLATLDAFAPGRSFRPRALLLPLLALLLVGGGIAFAMQTAVRPEPRTVTLLAQGMSFYLPGDPTPNPRLVAESGEEIRLVLRNQDRGIPHDLSVPDGDGGEQKATREVRGLGESADLTFRAPEVPGEYEYLCTLHSRMMRGVLEVR